MACSQPDPDLTLSRRLPLRGGLLSLLASAFRVRDCIEKASVVGMAKATAKRVLEDDPQVAPEKRAALVRALVAAIFTPEYLEARDLPAEEATVHNGLIAAALEDVLDRWDEQVRAMNHGIDVEGSVFAFHLLITGFVPDLLVRCAAYLVLYRRVHPVLGVLPSWLAQPGLKGAYQDLVGRTRGGQPSLERLRKDTGLHKRTLKALRDGSTDLPQGETIAQVAAAFAAYGVAGRERELATAAEIELELRAACAAVRLREGIVANPHLQVELHLHLEQLQRLRSELRRYSREELAEIVVEGMRWRRAEELLCVLRAHAGENLCGLGAEMHRRMQRILRMFHEHPQQGFRELAEQVAGMAQRAQTSAELGRRLGARGSEHLAHLYESMARVFAAMAGPSEERMAALERAAAAHVGFDEDELAAEDLAWMASMPWSEYSPAQREVMLREAVALCPSSTFVRLSLVDFLTECGKPAEALAHAYAARGEHPENPRIRVELADLLLPSSAEEALAELEAAHRLGEPTNRSLALQGEALRLLGLLADAERAFQRALDLHPRNAFALHRLALCRRAAGDERGARRLEKEVERYRSPG